MPPLDAAGRRAAALKAHATRRANKAAAAAQAAANGIPPPPPRPRAPRAPKPPKPQGKPNQNPFAVVKRANVVKFEAMAALEKAFLARLGEQGITQEARDEWEQYKKCKAMALNLAANNTAERNVAATALRVSMIKLVKLVF